MVPLSFVTLITLFSTLSSAAAVVENLPITKRIHTPSGFLDIVGQDRARIEEYVRRNDPSAKKVKRDSAVHSMVASNGGVSFSVSVGFGTPPTYYDLLVDTGSSNTWIGAKQAYAKTNSSKATVDNFSVTYGLGSATGTQYRDLVTISSSLTMENKSFGVADSTQEFRGVDGILGVGPRELTRGTLDPSTNSTVLTFVDNLFKYKKIPEKVLGIYFEPANVSDANNGQLTFGGIDKSKIVGSVTYVDTLKKGLYTDFWSFKQSIKLGNVTIQTKNTGIADTGTTLLYISPAAFKKYKAALSGSEIDSKTQLLKIPKASIKKMKSLFFIIGGVSFELTPNAQLWPRALNAALGGDSDAYYSIITAVTDYQHDLGLTFINGYTFLERFYSVYDSTESRVGFANTKFTHATTN